MAVSQIEKKHSLPHSEVIQYILENRDKNGIAEMKGPYEGLYGKITGWRVKDNGTKEAAFYDLAPDRKVLLNHHNNPGGLKKAA